jgi:hypothetical protein
VSSSIYFSTVITGLVPVIHFPEASHILHGFWKMDGRHKGGHDDDLPQ